MRKDVVVVVLGLLVVGLSVFLVRSLEKEHRALKGLEEERYSRMVAEESLQKNAAKLSTMQEQIKVASDKMAKIQDIVEQEKGVNADLKKQYAQLAEAKEALEAKVKTAVQEQTAQAPVAAPAK
ncbi:MAG: hypothetical protein HYZ86_04530 [Candidatus Omnitrophica bacterium]|nr:hypothetical protein [Candidatus Omnitrophota bacterium]